MITSTSATSEDDSEFFSEINQGIAEGLGFTIGGALFGFLIIWIGGKHIAKQIKGVLK